MKMTFTTRWPMKQTGEKQFEVALPDVGEPLINPQAAEALRLSDAEYEQANEAALRAVIILK